MLYEVITGGSPARVPRISGVSSESSGSEMRGESVAEVATIVFSGWTERDRIAAAILKEAAARNNFV